MNVTFYKYQGTGNDFILLDNRQNTYDALTQLQVKHMCNRHFGIGADGLMLLNNLEGFDFEMVYYNADGHISSMCGNGGRSIVRFARDKGIVKDTYRFMAVDGEHLATVDERDWVKLKMIDVSSIGRHNDDFIVDTGSPHYVKLEHDVMNKDVFGEGKRIRYSSTFEQDGINVNFVEQQAGNIRVRTYERGVEDETLSCGTGVTASALVSAPNQPGFNRVDVKTLGGDLAVEFIKEGPEQFRDIWLCGPAAFVFKGEISLDH